MVLGLCGGYFNRSRRFRDRRLRHWRWLWLCRCCLWHCNKRQLDWLTRNFDLASLREWPQGLPRRWDPRRLPESD